MNDMERMEKSSGNIENPNPCNSLKELLLNWKILTPALLTTLLGVVAGHESGTSEESASRNVIIREAMSKGRAEQMTAEKLDTLWLTIINFRENVSRNDTYGGGHYPYLFDKVTIALSGVSEKVDHVALKELSNPSGSSLGYRIVINEIDPTKKDRAYFLENPTLHDGHSSDSSWHVPRRGFMYFEGDNLRGKPKSVTPREESGDLDSLQRKIHKQSDYNGEISYATFVNMYPNNGKDYTDRALILDRAVTYKGDLDHENMTVTHEYDIARHTSNTVMSAAHIEQMMEHDQKLIKAAIDKIKEELGPDNSK